MQPDAHRWRRVRGTDSTVAAPPAIATSGVAGRLTRLCASADSIPSVTKWNVVPPGIRQRLTGEVGEDEHRRVIGRVSSACSNIQRCKSPVDPVPERRVEPLVRSGRKPVNETAMSHLTLTICLCPFLIAIEVHLGSHGEVGADSTSSTCQTTSNDELDQIVATVHDHDLARFRTAEPLAHPGRTTRW